MSWGHRPSGDEFSLNSRVLDEAARALLKSMRVVRTHDVPYVGSCNIAGDTIYIDYELPAHLMYRGSRYDVDRYIVMHEVVEMLLEHHLQFSYRDAHQIATAMERALVQSDGLSWAVYSRFCSIWSKKVGQRKTYPDPPLDIDLQPERDTKDATRLKRMRLPAKKKAPSKKPGTRRQRD
jgi:hypothetical protein